MEWGGIRDADLGDSFDVEDISLPSNLTMSHLEVGRHTSQFDLPSDEVLLLPNPLENHLTVQPVLANPRP
jgi:hypothetical protein